jgi:hypothetical protein
MRTLGHKQESAIYMLSTIEITNGNSRHELRDNSRRSGGFPPTFERINISNSCTVKSFPNGFSHDDQIGQNRPFF